jgi:hypothetical protein
VDSCHDDSCRGEYKWYDEVSKAVSFAHTTSHDKCCKDLCRKDLSEGRTIACNMCPSVWHADCLVPPLTPQQCDQLGLFCCSSECATRADEVEGEGYKWFPEVSKTVSFAHEPSDEVCRNELCRKDLSEGRTIVCSMCTWVWHADCLVPPVKPERLDAGFLCCSPACTQEAHDFIHTL